MTTTGLKRLVARLKHGTREGDERTPILDDSVTERPPTYSVEGATELYAVNQHCRALHTLHQYLCDELAVFKDEAPAQPSSMPEYTCIVTATAAVRQLGVMIQNTHRELQHARKACVARTPHP